MDKTNKFEEDIKMLTYFHDEFMYRHKHYWDTLIKLFLLTVVISILPITTQIFGIELSHLPRLILFCFPALGLIVSVFSLVILHQEAKRMSAVNTAKYRINKQMDPLYHYDYFDKDEKKKSTPLSLQMPVVVFLFEFIIILGVFLTLIIMPIETLC